MNRRDLWEEIRKWVVIAAGGEGLAVGEAVLRIGNAAEEYARSGTAPLSAEAFRARLAEIRAPLLAILPRSGTMEGEEP